MLLLYPHKERKDWTVSSLIFSWESRIRPDLFISPSEKRRDARLDSLLGSVDSAQFKCRKKKKHYTYEIQYENVKSKFSKLVKLSIDQYKTNQTALYLHKSIFDLHFSINWKRGSPLMHWSKSSDPIVIFSGIKWCWLNMCWLKD